MKKRSEVTAQRKQLALPQPEAPKEKPQAITLRELARFLETSGASMHLRYGGGKFVVVVHHAARGSAFDCSDPELEAAVRAVMVSS